MLEQLANDSGRSIQSLIVSKVDFFEAELLLNGRSLQELSVTMQIAVLVHLMLLFVNAHQLSVWGGGGTGLGL